MTDRPRVLIEDWLPAQAIGIECMRENSTGQHPPPNRLHVWWARRPLTVSRAAVLGSLLPADFDREMFERLLGFYASSEQIVDMAGKLASKPEGVRIKVGHGRRAFGNTILEPDVSKAHQAIDTLWRGSPKVLDPMAGGGSIPLEAVRMGLNTVANEYNPVACSVLETTLMYPNLFDADLVDRAKHWAGVWEKRFDERMQPYYEYDGFVPPRDYIFARTVPCPDTGHPTPLIGDWSLSRPKGKPHIVANPIITDPDGGEWTIEVRQVGKSAGQLRQPPLPTYSRGKGWSLFTRTEMPSEYIKAMAQQGKMGSVLYTVVTKATKLEFRPPEPADLRALEAAESELERLRPRWERDGIIPTEEYPEVSSDPRPRLYGMPRWADMFAPRQLLAMGTLVEELQRLRPEILAAEGEEGEAIVHLLSLALDKYADYNCYLNTWESTREIVKHVFQRHDFSFKATFAEMAPCVSGGGLAWATHNVLDAYEKLVTLPRAAKRAPAAVTQGSATNLLDLDDKTIIAVVVDPPYAGNVQYSELANFFYVWLKRTQGHRRPEWFSTYLCDHDEEAVVNVSRHRDEDETAKVAKAEANEFYQEMMADVFRECNRVLRDDGVLTVMFTHKKQEAWASLFESLIAAGFTITATWPVRTESQHSLHQARKNSAQSSVILVARKRDPGAGWGYYDESMQAAIREAAQKAADRLNTQGLNAVDQLVGAFGPAMEVFTRHAEVRTDTGERVSVSNAIQAAADAVADWRVDQLAEHGLDDVDAASRFILLCWDVLGAQEFRFNEAMLLGRSVGMDVDKLIGAGLVKKKSEKVLLLTAQERRREKPVKDEAEQMELFKGMGRGRRRVTRQIHPNDEYFDSAVDMCHALALRYAEAGGGQAGIGAARGMALQQGWGQDSPCARMMAALLHAAPEAVRFPGEKGKRTAADDFPEFRAWHTMLTPLFGIEPSEWAKPIVPQPGLL